MPVYEFVCHSCGSESSHLMSADSTEEMSCPSCGKTTLKKQISKFSSGRSETDRITEATERLTTANDQATGAALKEVGRAYDEDLSNTISEMYEADQEEK